jgi:hypothetical protein
MFSEMIPFLDKKGVARYRKHGQDERENNQTKVGHFFVYTTEKKIFWAFLVHLNSGTFFFKILWSTYVLSKDLGSRGRARRPCRTIHHNLGCSYSRARLL